MPSDPKRLQQVYDHIQRIKAGDYPAVVGRDGDYQILDRPWNDLAERSKLAILTESVDWSGITNRDQSHILLSQIDPYRLPDDQRNRLVDTALTLSDIFKSRPSEAREIEHDNDRSMGM